LLGLLLAVIALLAGVGCAPVAPAGQTPAAGEYTVAVTLTGGSGKASVSSPTKLTVTAEQLIAEVVWSSPHYTWMEVDGTTYTPVNAAGGNSVFQIPVTLDADLPISAETVAMSRPRTIEYTLRFESASLTRS
jgi:iron complex transport system substrate-binding protein